MGAITPRLAGLIAAALLLAGCGGSPEPQPLPRPTASLSPSASESPSAPVLPEAGKAKTKAGAEALVRHFIAALNFAGQSGDTRKLREAFVASCTRCDGLAGGIDKTYAAGGYYKGGDWVPSEIKFYAIDRGIATLDATVDYTAQVWVKKAGAEPTKFRSSKNHLHAFQLKWLPKRGWRVGALDPQL